MGNGSTAGWKELKQNYLEALHGFCRPTLKTAILSSGFFRTAHMWTNLNKIKHHVRNTAIVTSHYEGIIRVYLSTSCLNDFSKGDKSIQKHFMSSYFKNDGVCVLSLLIVQFNYPTCTRRLYTRGDLCTLMNLARGTSSTKGGIPSRYLNIFSNVLQQWRLLNPSNVFF